MDTSDPAITFDENGICNHCTHFYNFTMHFWKRGAEGFKLLQDQIETIKYNCRNKNYDGIIGLSGGVDSSYLLCKTKEWGLRLLAVHVDAGWNSEVAVQNIELLCKHLNIDLHTLVIDWPSIRDIQNAFMRSGVENQDIPQDHAFFAALYKYAVKNKVRYVFDGSNISTESILPTAWGHDAMDLKYLRGIVKKFGRIGSLKKYPTVNFWQYHFYFPYLKRMKIIRPLNYLNYNKQSAIAYLESNYGWRYYGAKHGESRFTKFFQGHYLIERFGYDKRRAHLSSLIVADQISRTKALQELNKPPYEKDYLEQDVKFILKKLQIAPVDFDLLIKATHLHTDLPSNQKLIFALGLIMRTFKKIVKFRFLELKKSKR